jgi:hypothetical protein
MVDDPSEEREPTLLVDAAERLADAVFEQTQRVCVRLQAGRVGSERLQALRALLDDSPGTCPVEVVIVLPDGAEAVLALDGTRVAPSEAMLAELERVFGDSVAELR